MTELHLTGDSLCRVHGEPRRLRIRDVGATVENFKDPFPRRHAALQEVRDPSERDHRPRQHHEVRVERDQLADRHPPRHHLPAAEPEHEECADTHQEGHARVVHRLHADQSAVAPHVLLVGEPEALDFEGLLAVRPNHSHAGQGLLRHRADLGQLLLDTLEPPVDGWPQSTRRTRRRGAAARGRTASATHRSRA